MKHRESGCALKGELTRSAASVHRTLSPSFLRPEAEEPDLVRRGQVLATNIGGSGRPSSYAGRCQLNSKRIEGIFCN